MYIHYHTHPVQKDWKNNRAIARPIERFQTSKAMTRPMWEAFLVWPPPPAGRFVHSSVPRYTFVWFEHGSATTFSNLILSACQLYECNHLGMKKELQKSALWCRHRSTSQELCVTVRHQLCDSRRYEPRDPDPCGAVPCSGLRTVAPCNNAAASGALHVQQPVRWKSHLRL